MAHLIALPLSTPKPAIMASSMWFAYLLASAPLTSSESFSNRAPNVFGPKPGQVQATQVALNSGDYIPVQGGDALQIQASFIVRFEGEPEVTTIARNFRKDPAAAQVRFAQWARQHAALRGLILTSASYSGDLILSLPANDPLNRRPRDVLSALRAMESCAYAELDSVAYPSSGDK